MPDDPERPVRGRGGARHHPGEPRPGCQDRPADGAGDADTHRQRVPPGAGYLDQQPRLLVRLAVASGARWGELTELRGADLADDTVLISRNVAELKNPRRFEVQPAPKNGKSRKVKIPPALAAEVHAHAAGPGSLLFPAPDGRHISREQFHVIWHRAQRAAASIPRAGCMTCATRRCPSGSGRDAVGHRTGPCGAQQYLGDLAIHPRRGRCRGRGADPVGGMTDMNDDNPFPDDMPVLVRFPRSQGEERGNRSAWPWLRGVIQQRVGEDEWQVCVADRAVATADDGTPAPDDTPDEDLWHPVVYRDSSELRQFRGNDSARPPYCGSYTSAHGC